MVAVSMAGPNPASSSTAIRFALATTGRVQVDLFNVNGQKVATPFDGWVDAGEHTIDISATGLPSGVYFVRFEGGNQVSTTKLVLLNR
jgi:hypothetical protein